MSSVQRFEEFNSKFEGVNCSSDIPDIIPTTLNGVYLSTDSTKVTTMYIISKGRPIAVIVVLRHLNDATAVDITMIDSDGDNITTAHIDSSYDESIDDIIYTLFDYYKLYDYMETLSTACIINRKPMSKTMYQLSTHEFNWKCILGKTGRAFLRDHRLSFLRAEGARCYNRLQLNLHNAKLKSLNKGHITTFDSGRIIICSLNDYDVIVLTDEEVNLATMFNMYCHSIDIIRNTFYKEDYSRLTGLDDYFGNISKLANNIDGIPRTDPELLNQYLTALIQ